MQMFADFYKLSCILSSLVLWTCRANESNSKKLTGQEFNKKLDLNWPAALSLALLKTRAIPTSKYEIILFELMFDRPMNFGLRPYPMSNLTESSHNHIQYLKVFISSLETVTHKVLRTWNNPLE